MAELPHFLRAAAAPPAPGPVRVRLTPPGGEVVSVWADRAPAGFALHADPGVAAGWAAEGRGFSGTVTAVDGLTISVE